MAGMLCLAAGRCSGNMLLRRWITGRVKEVKWRRRRAEGPPGSPELAWGSSTPRTLQAAAVAGAQETSGRHAA